MADYIYLLENRLSAAQQRAIRIVRDLARTEEMTVFLTGGAVRDLTAGSAVRDLDLTVVGDAMQLRAGMEAAGAIFTGDNPAAKVVYFLLPGGVRVEVSTAVTVEFPKPGHPVYAPAGIIEDLRRRDFTANAMALSLNEGSYGLLMDPLNGVADIENRELRLISNYGFIEDPIRMVRGIRLSARLGWQMEERTRQRYENAKSEELFPSASPTSVGYELEEIFYEEDPIRVMRALDAEGWLKLLSPELAAAKPNEAALTELREKQGQLLTQGVLADASALALPLLLGKMSPAEQAAIKNAFARSGFATHIDSLESRTRDFQTRFAGKEAATPSAAWRMLHEAEPELVLSMLLSGKGVVQQRLKTFLNDSPTARQRIPYATLQEMRITPDLPEYPELLDKLFFELMDGKLSTPEELKAYLEPYSPPAPPPPVNLRRARAKKEARPSRAKGKKAAAAEAELPATETVAEQEEALGVAEGLMEPGTLTGPDRGTEPTEETPLEGKVAPLAPGEKEPVSPKPAKAKSPKPLTVSPDADTKAAKQLSAKPAPVATKKEKAATTPHPIAAREVAAKRPVTIPAASTKPAAATKPAAGKTAKTQPAPQKAAKVAPPASKGSKSVKPVPATKKGSAPAAKTSAKNPAPTGKSNLKQPSKAAKTAPAKKVVAASPAKRKPAPPPAKASAKKQTKVVAAKKAPAKVVSKAPAKKAASGKPAKKAGKR